MQCSVGQVRTVKREPCSFSLDLPLPQPLVEPRPLGGADAAHRTEPAQP